MNIIYTHTKLNIQNAKTIYRRSQVENESESAGRFLKLICKAIDKGGKRDLELS